MNHPNKQFSNSPSSHSDGSLRQSLQQRRLTKQKRLRYLTDQDAGVNSTSSLPASPLPCFNIGSCSDHWSSSAVPQPLPLPETPLTHRSESTILYSASYYAHLGSPSFENRAFPFFRKSMDHDTVRNFRSSTNLGSASSSDAMTMNAKHDLKVKIPATRVLGGHSSCKDPRQLSHETISNMKLHSATKSAPTSILSSPVTSPRRTSNVDLFDPSLHFHQHFNDILKVSLAKTVPSPEYSPHLSPGSRSHFLNPNTEEGSKQHKFCSRVWPENNHVYAHPLPLPPKDSLPSQICTQHQSSIMHHTTENSPSLKGPWQKGKLIGRGSFGSVYHGTNLETGASCAMKEVDLIPDDPKSADCIKQLEQEIRILRQLKHPNIVQYYGSEIVGDHLYIYMEYVYPGSINKFMHDHCRAMTEPMVRNFTWHILSGLAYLHSKKTIHRDIKGPNLLVNASGTVKLADFGVAKILTGKSYQLSLKGSPYWMAPELMMAAIKKESSPKLAMAVDIWSLGCTIIEMLTGKPPWSEFEEAQAMFKVLHKSPTIPETLSSEGQDFLLQCFRRNPADRPSAAMLLTHTFVQNLHDQAGSGDNCHSPECSPEGRDIVPLSASIRTRIINKIHNLIGDTSKNLP
ncbi:PREDICTED: mitogen-activated protein kinase kinase kinase YODA-like isoform X1 [Lupinus angustifolius]|uniref:mitogen-activated protein kinase kinase kinase YODA-like isoform X1 n=1 Tax=Lupinus angustifolius TaxID=3871 RepID=UPI00092E2D96|nr:PREDICTED: mitogen-activated protein kinase kinase kinase YODA-like isoform X1 [Lupinus angustifolius]